MSLDETCDKTRSSPTRFSSMLWPTVELARYWSPKKMRCAHGCGHRVSWAVRSHVKRSQDDLHPWLWSSIHDWDHQDFAGLPYCTWWLLLDTNAYQCVACQTSCFSINTLLLYRFMNQPHIFAVWVGSRKGSVVLAFHFPIRHQDPIFVPQARVCFHGNCEAKNRRKSGAFYSKEALMSFEHLPKPKLNHILMFFANKNSFGIRKRSCRFFWITWQPMVLIGWCNPVVQDWKIRIFRGFTCQASHTLSILFAEGGFTGYLNPSRYGWIRT